ncbi:hypothetical protein LINPERHAP1_LOCUS40504 [Linum perenne]
MMKFGHWQRLRTKVQANLRRKVVRSILNCALCLGILLPLEHLPSHLGIQEMMMVINTLKFMDLEKMKLMSKKFLNQMKLKSKYSKKPKVADDGPYKHMMDGMVEQRKRTNDLLERKLDMASAASKHHRSQSLLDCMILLQDMEIEDVQFTKALGILEATVNFRQCFLKMNEDRRIGWVRNLECAKSD